MQFVYKPEGAERRWDFDPMKLMNVEAEAIERHTGMTYGDWTEKVTEGSMLALHGLLFVLLKRESPTLKWAEVEFSLSEVDFEIDDGEKAEILAALQSRLDAGETLPDNEATVYEQFRADVGAAPVDDDEPASDVYDAPGYDLDREAEDAEAPKEPELVGLPES